MKLYYINLETLERLLDSGSIHVQTEQFLNSGVFRHYVRLKTVFLRSFKVTLVTRILETTYMYGLNMSLKTAALCKLRITLIATILVDTKSMICHQMILKVILL